MSPRAPGPARPLSQALDQSEPLARLMQRLQTSQDCFAAVSELLPPAWRAEVRCGPLEDKGWTLLAANSAVAAKLKQLIPTMEQALQARSLPGVPVRVKVLPPR